MAKVNFRVVDNEDERIRIVYDITSDAGEVVATTEADVRMAAALGETAVIDDYTTKVNARLTALGKKTVTGLDGNDARILGSRLAEISSNLYALADQKDAERSRTV